MSRAAVIQIIRDATAVPVYGSNAVDTPDESQFCIVRFEETTKAFGLVGSQRITVWVHDTDRNYDFINAALGNVKEALTNAIHTPGADGGVLSQATWNGDSADLFDDGYETCTRNAGFDINSR